jgi:phospholipid/cholesterol/gamma-HCH transport system permease protein
MAELMRKKTTQMTERMETNPAVALVEEIGRQLSRRMMIAGRATLLFVDAASYVTQVGRSIPAMVRQLEISGFGSLFVLALIAGLTGMIMAVQTGGALKQYGALNQLGAVIGATFCREMGPLWAAVIILARVGSSMAAEIGTMVVNEEVDALRAMSINPVRFLVMPRVLALVIAMPILAAVADWVGIFGGAVVSRMTFDVQVGSFMDSVRQGIDGMDFFSGLFKSAIFACIIGTIACDRGLNTSDGAEGVGRATTESVVLNVIFVLLADLLMTTFIQLWLR